MDKNTRSYVIHGYVQRMSRDVATLKAVADSSVIYSCVLITDFVQVGAELIRGVPGHVCEILFR
jgi:hypothetical protein